MLLLVLLIALYARLADAFLCWNDRLLLLVHSGRRVEKSADNAFDDQAYLGVRGTQDLDAPWPKQVRSCLPLWRLL